MRKQDLKVTADHVALAARYPREYALFRKYRDRSMVPRRKFIENVRLMRNLSVAGCVVECGCWEGGMSGAIAEVLPDRTFYLLDSFEGLPDAGADDSERDHALLARDRLVSTDAIAADTMRRSGANHTLVRGWFRDTVPALEVDEIAVLRLDGDLYDSTLVCLEVLYPRVAPGGAW